MNTEGFKPQNETQEDSLEKIRADIESGALTLENASVVEAGLNTTTADSLIKEVYELTESDSDLNEGMKNELQTKILEQITIFKGFQDPTQHDDWSDSHKEEIRTSLAKLHEASSYLEESVKLNKAA